MSEENVPESSVYSKGATSTVRPLRWHISILLNQTEQIEQHNEEESPHLDHDADALNCLVQAERARRLRAYLKRQYIPPKEGAA